MADLYEGITYVIPCGGAKLDHAAPGRALYVGQMFRHTLTRVEQLAALDEAEGRGPARVLILSARYGLIDPDQVIEPYDQRMDAKGSVTAEVIAEQALAFGIDWGAQVYALLPRPYLARLDEALRTHDVYVQDVYEATAGIGEQRRVNAIIARPTVVPPDQAGPAPVVWIGAGVEAFGWEVPIMVSYGRLRDARTMPVATAPWVIDSRGYTELTQHGTWTIDPAQYAADLRRYATEIGHLTWAAAQDWPASAAVLERTGLTEVDHQRRTVASVIQLRAIGPDLPIIAVVTGTTVDGYLRHDAMYERAGIDLRTERSVVGVGALVGRPPADVAAIVRALYDAGLRRLHGFGVKGRVLETVGGLLASIDSAAWSAEARHQSGPCPHGLVTWERNCPEAAKAWAVRQRARAAVGLSRPDLFSEMAA